MSVEKLQNLLATDRLTKNATRYFNEVIKLTESAQEKGGLLKTQFNEINTKTNRMFEVIWGAEIKNAYFSHMEDETLRDIYYSQYPIAHTIKGFKKRLGKLEKTASPEAQKVISNAYELIDDLMPFAENINELKTMIKTQAELKQMDPKRKDEFQAPLASKATRDKLKEALNEALAPLKDEVQNDIRNMILRQVDRYYEGVSENNTKRRNSPYYVLARDAFARQNVTHLLDEYKGDPETGAYGKRDDFEDRLNNKSAQFADEILYKFVAKQIQKIPGLIDSNGAVETMSVNITNKNAGNGSIEGSIAVKMKNNVSFEARTQVVFSHSVKGKLFPRYPTTFHNVHDTSGKQVAKRMSEKEMYSTNDFSPQP